MKIIVQNDVWVRITMLSSLFFVFPLIKTFTKLISLWFFYVRATLRIHRVSVVKLINKFFTQTMFFNNISPSLPNRTCNLTINVITLHHTVYCTYTVGQWAEAPYLPVWFSCVYCTYMFTGLSHMTRSAHIWLHMHTSTCSIHHLQERKWLYIT